MRTVCQLGVREVRHWVFGFGIGVLIGPMACVGDMPVQPECASNQPFNTGLPSEGEDDRTSGVDGSDRVELCAASVPEVVLKPSIREAESALRNTHKTVAQPSDEGTVVPPPSEPTEICDGVDNDGDGLIDEGFLDLDKDGDADCVDLDDDADGVLDTHDSCPHVPNASQADSDMDGIGDACDLDGDGDGVPIDEDCDDWSTHVYPHHPEICDGLDNNCSGDVDEGFPDTDQDGQADCVDLDDDNDGVLDANDTCPLVHNPSQYPVNCGD